MVQQSFTAEQADVVKLKALAAQTGLGKSKVIRRLIRLARVEDVLMPMVVLGEKQKEEQRAN